MRYETVVLSDLGPPQSGGSLVVLSAWSSTDETLQAAAQDNLRHLVAVCVDSLDALADAIKLAHDPAVRRQLAQIRAVRASTRDALSRSLTVQDGGADKRGTFAGAVHHWFNRVRVATSGKDPVVALIALESAEDRVRRLFLAALRTKMPLEAEEAIRSAFRQVLRCHDGVYALARQARSAA